MDDTDVSVAASLVPSGIALSCSSPRKPEVLLKTDPLPAFGPERSEGQREGHRKAAKIDAKEESDTRVETPEDVGRLVCRT